MFTLIFPTKKHPEDTNGVVAFLAKCVFWGGLCSLLWSGYQLSHWVRSSSFESTTGMVSHGSLRLITTGVKNVSFDYQVEGRDYTSQSIVFGGRPMGRVPTEGPVTVYYDRANPELAVLYKRPAEQVWLALFLGLISPFIARFIWNTYA